MQNSLFDLLRAALVPVLCADVAAGATGHVHGFLVVVAAVRAFPDQLVVLVFNNLNLAGVAAFLAVVGFGVQLGVEDCVVDVTHQRDDRIEVVVHIGHFHVGNRTARGQLLEFGFQFQLGEGIDFFGYVHVIGVGDVGLVRNARDDAEAFLQFLRKLVGRGFQRCAIEGEVHVFLGFPALAVGIQAFHDAHAEGHAFRIGVGYTLHIVHAFAEAGIA